MLLQLLQLLLINIYIANCQYHLGQDFAADLKQQSKPALKDIHNFFTPKQIEVDWEKWGKTLHLDMAQTAAVETWLESNIAFEIRKQFWSGQMVDLYKPNTKALYDATHQKTIVQKYQLGNFDKTFKLYFGLGRRCPSDKIGTGGTLYGPLATSSEYKEAKTFANSGSGGKGGGQVFEIEMKKGALNAVPGLLDISAFKDEKEWLLWDVPLIMIKLNKEYIQATKMTLPKNGPPCFVKGTKPLPLKVPQPNVVVNVSPKIVCNDNANCNTITFKNIYVQNVKSTEITFTKGKKTPLLYIFEWEAWQPGYYKDYTTDEGGLFHFYSTDPDNEEMGPLLYVASEELVDYMSNEQLAMSANGANKITAAKSNSAHQQYYNNYAAKYNGYNRYDKYHKNNFDETNQQNSTLNYDIYIVILLFIIFCFILCICFTGISGFIAGFIVFISYNYIKHNKHALYHDDISHSKNDAV